MPTYAYRCADCDHAFDIHQAFTDDSLTECPECGGQLRKVFGTVGVTFKGSGFYRTDSRGSKSATTSSSGPSSSDASKPAAAPAAATSSSSSSSSGGSSGASGSSGSGGSSSSSGSTAKAASA
nr:FmdB family zinc ribbon protein [Antribacter gilvus]